MFFRAELQSIARSANRNITGQGAIEVTIAEILDGLQTRIIGREIALYEQIESTNELALQRGIKGAKEGTLILAEHQRAGRGRHGRKWLAPPASSLLASLILRHRLLDTQIGIPNLMGAVAIATAIRELTTLPALIRWPNDVLLYGKKVSGVLTELEYDWHRRPFFVMGFGVNVNTSPKDLPVSLRPSATSLRIECGREISRVALLQATLHRLEDSYLRLKRGKTPSIVEMAIRLSYTLGRWVEIETLDGVFGGQAEKIHPDGGLLLRNTSGQLRKFLVGEVVHTRTGDGEIR